MDDINMFHYLYVIYTQIFIPEIMWENPSSCPSFYSGVRLKFGDGI